MPSLGRVYRERGNRWFIQLPGRIRIYCDKQHRPFHSREHAEWVRAQIHGEAERGVFDPKFYQRTKLSLNNFEVYALAWLGNCDRRLERKELSPTYIKQVRRYVRKRFIPAFGSMDIREIRGKHLKEFYLRLEGNQKTVLNIMAVLRKLFRDAYQEEVIEAVPNFPTVATPPEPETVWADEQQQDEIFNHLDPESFFFIYFLATHGCRPGEGRALRHEDLDLKRDTVTVRRAFADQELRPFPKSKRVRVIPLDPSWKEIYLTRPVSLDRDVFVFQHRGKPLSKNWAANKWREAAHKAGYHNISLYQGTRHSIASQAINRDVPLFAVSKFLGHSNSKMTERYSHLNTSGLRKVQRLATVTRIVKKG